MDLPSIICFLILIFGLSRPVGFLLSTAWALLSFGSLAIVPTELTGGTSLTASTMGMVFVVVKVLAMPGSISRLIGMALNLQQLGFLTLFTLDAIIGAAVLPVVFQGAVMVFPLRLGAYYLPELLSPTTANFTQSMYLTISFFVTASFSWLVRDPRFVERFGRAIITGGIVVVVTGLCDILGSSIGLGDVLSIFRTATYGLLATGEDAPVEGLRRVIGLMPEASAFGTLVFFYFSLLLFTRHSYAPSVNRWIISPLLAACGLFTVISTSSTAYAELSVTILLFVLKNVYGVLFGSAGSRNLRELALVLVIFTMLFFGAMFFDETRNTVYSVFDQMVLQKSESSSYVERSSWTRVALEAWVATDGLGVGTGSVRASNLFANILASTGFPGFILFSVFLLKVFASPLPKNDHRLATLVLGAKFTLLATLVGAALAGTSPDYGSINAALFGIIVGATALNSSRSRTVKPPLPSAQARATTLPS